MSPGHRRCAGAGSPERWEWEMTANNQKKGKLKGELATMNTDAWVDERD
jgi:hypothetical protein